MYTTIKTSLVLESCLSKVNILKRNALKSVFLVCISLLFLSCNVKAQNIVTRKSGDSKAHRLYERARTYERQRLPDKAIEDYKKVIKLEPNFIDAHIAIGAFYYERKIWSKAEASFAKALELDKTYTPQLYYTLGLSQLEQKKFSDANKSFQTFLEVGTDEKYASLRKKANMHIETVRFKAENNNRSVSFDPKPLGPGINTQFLEYLPSLTADEETMVITRNDGYQEDFYVSEKVDGEWTQAFPLKSINRPNTNEGAQTISQDGKLLFYTVCDGRNDFGSCDLYFAEVVNGRWTKAKNMGAQINGAGWDTQPTISADKKNLYYTSKRKGSVGGSDIWMSTRSEDGEWGKPINLGEVINTAGDEASPFIHPDNNTLYFMSDGHTGFGGDDLFYSRRQADGSWGRPKNMGYPINTDSNEGSLVVSANGQTAYFATDRFNKGKNKNRYDIYSFELYEEARPEPVTYVRAKVIDAETKQPLSANLDITDLGGQKSYYKEKIDDQGIFLIPLPVGKQYALNIEKKGYLIHSENFALENIKTVVDPFLMIIELQKIPPVVATTTSSPVPTSEPITKPIVLKNVFFETASAELKPISITELDKLYNFLSSDSKLRIQLNGHTDNVGSDSDNLTLSDARAKAVKDYLIDKGISSDRLRAKGFGESVPVASNDTEEGRMQNRRTEFQLF